MPVSYVTGDLFASRDLDGIGHGCNCAGAMGAGIAVEFRRRWPKMFDEYRARCRDGRFGLGDVFVWKDSGLTIFNLGTQRTWRTKATIEAIETALARMLEIAREERLARVGLPRIGAGLGGLDWSPVKAALSRVGEASAVHLVVFERVVADERV